MSSNHLGVGRLKGGMDLATRFRIWDSTEVVIQEIPTGLYWDGKGGGWTSDLENATTFPTRSGALNEMGRMNLSTVRQVVRRELEGGHRVLVMSSARA